MKLTKVHAIAALIVVLGGASTQVGRAVNYYAKASTVERIEDDLEAHKIRERMKEVQERMWAMEDRWGERFKEEEGRRHQSEEELLAFMTDEAREQYRELREEYAVLKARLERLEND